MFLYGTVGYMSADASITGAPVGFTIDGVTYGLGAEVMVSEGMAVRAEYGRGDFDLEGPGGGVGVTTDSFSIGAVFRF